MYRVLRRFIQSDRKEDRAYKAIAAMRIVMHNDEDVKMVEYIKEGIYNNILELLDEYKIDVSHLNKERIEDIIIDLSRLGYEYRHILFAIDDYEDRIYNEVIIDTNEFCNEEGIY